MREAFEAGNPCLAQWFQWRGSCLNSPFHHGRQNTRMEHFTNSAGFFQGMMWDFFGGAHFIVLSKALTEQRPPSDRYQIVQSANVTEKIRVPKFAIRNGLVSYACSAHGSGAAFPFLGGVPRKRRDFIFTIFVFGCCGASRKP